MKPDKKQPRNKNGYKIKMAAQQMAAEKSGRNKIAEKMGPELRTNDPSIPMAVLCGQQVRGLLVLPVGDMRA